MAKKKSNTMLWIMLALIAIIIAVLFLLPSCGSSKRQADNTEKTTLVHVDEVAPDFTVSMLDGSQITLSSLRGKVVLLNFWATWCPPCCEELTRVQTDIIDRFAGKDFVFLPISRGETLDAVTAFRKKNGYTFPMGLDPAQTIYDKFASNYIPRNFLINKSGKVVFTSVGYEAEEFEHLIQIIEKTLE